MFQFESAKKEKPGQTVQKKEPQHPKTHLGTFITTAGVHTVLQMLLEFISSHFLLLNVQDIVAHEYELKVFVGNHPLVASTQY